MKTILYVRCLNINNKGHYVIYNVIQYESKT